MKKPVISRIVPLVAILALILLLFGFRYLGFVDANFANLAPVSAMALCFGLFFRQSVLAVVIAFAALVLSDVFVTVLAVRQDPNLSFWALMVSPTVLLRYAVYGCLFAVVCFWMKRSTPRTALALTPAMTLAFYVIMNTVAWLTSVAPFAYAKTVAGWWQSQTVGLPIPGAPPSYFFLRNALIGDLLFTVLFVGLVVCLPSYRRTTDSALKLSENAV
ncbi:hypothetical protein N8525_01795 [Verrucomicrobiales bacterium]|nr:hypothetical protein [Verrucomicrobiales bacterium]